MRLNELIRYFDLASEIRPKEALPMGERKEFHWSPQYFALLTGIVTQRFFQEYMTTGKWNLAGFWSWLLAACIIAIMVFPGVYKKAFDPEKPLFIQICVIFTTGIGWQAVAGTALKAAGVATKAAATGN